MHKAITAISPAPATLGFSGLFLASAMLIGAPLPGHAAGTFQPPAGCQLELTVQNRGCTVSQHYRCSADTKGDQWATYFSPDGPTYEAKIDAETQWLYSKNMTNGIEDQLVSGAKDPASFSTLVKTGRDDFDFWTESNNGEKLHHVGHDELTGEKATIGGVELERTRFDLKTYSESGELLMSRTGGQYISRAQGRFYGGTENASDWTGAKISTDESPMRFAFPGQPGFGSTTPEYDCDMQMVQAPTLPILRAGALLQSIPTAHPEG